MALQTTIENYFNSRKRQAVDDIKKGNEKVQILDKNEFDTPKESKHSERLIHFKSSSNSCSTSKSCVAPKLQRKTPKTAPRSLITGLLDTRKVQSSAKKSLLSCFNATELKENTIKKQATAKGNVKKSLLTSFDASSKETKELVKEEVSRAEEKHSGTVLETKSNELIDPVIKPNKESSSAEGSSATRTLDNLKKYDKDLDVSSLKKKLIRSSRLEELKNALKKVNEGHKKLEKIQSRSQSTPTKSPSLKQFKSIELEVITSPSKVIATPEKTKLSDSPSLLRRAVFMSPTKSAPNSQPYISPKKLFADSFNSAIQKSPETSTKAQVAYERFYSLASSGKPSLTLPFSYRSLAETFRAVDTVASLMHNRSETILFSKLKSSVQQLSKKNFYESHLGQIKTIFSNAYTFTQEKIRIIGNQHESYELVIKPVFESKEEAMDKTKNVMTPSLLLGRKRIFYNTLLDIVKNHHEEFLKTLDPPLVVPKDKLTRWHPAFNVDGCPDIESAELPQPPNIERFSTAKDVLNKARDLFGVNPRMEKALERLSENNNTNTTTSKTIPALANALKGIPKSLLEKVRARQAAKAVELLTRNPEENKRRYELTRLPELARLIRNIFVTEKKNIIGKHVLIKKLCESFREIMDQAEMTRHLNLLLEVVPGWIIINAIGDKEFIKLCKKTDLNEVLTKINDLIAKNSINS